MTGIWAAQMACNVILFALVAASWWLKRSGGRGDEKLTAYLNVLESRATQLESESTRYRDRCETQLKTLARICDSARTILDRGRWQHSLYPTLEEDELKEAASPESPAGTDSLSPLHTLERATERLRRPESGLDLKSLLKDQLA